MKLVPNEPTDEMLWAARVPDDCRDFAKGAFRKMIAAVPALTRGDAEQAMRAVWNETTFGEDTDRDWDDLPKPQRKMGVDNAVAFLRALGLEVR